jgi:hypothetical protein
VGYRILTLPLRSGAGAFFGEVMPRYFFEIKNGHRLPDPAGLDCRDDDDALAKAQDIARQIVVEANPPPGRNVAVVDETGREIGKVTITETEKRR